MAGEKKKLIQVEKGKSVKRTAEPPGHGPVGHFEGYQPRALQRAAANPVSAESPVFANPADILALGRRYGNRAVQRLLAQRQRRGNGFDLDDRTARRINRARGGGQPLARSLQEQISPHTGYDFSGVRVHTGSESDQLNRQLGARAFTTGRDIFFRRGEYNPRSSSGRELIAHELSHVVQQGTGRVPHNGSRMTVRPSDDSFEQEARLAARNAAKRSEQPQWASLPSFGVQTAGAATIQRALADHIAPKALAAEHPAVIVTQADYDAAREKNDGKIRIKHPVGASPTKKNEILCTQAVGLARRSGQAVGNLGQLVDLQSAEETAARNDAAGTVINEGDYKKPGKVVHWITGDPGNRAHKHSAVVTAAGTAAGYNQTECVSGGKGPGIYNVGKIKWPEGVTVKLTD